ncbi:hypothetical protein ACIOG8_31585 [Streptomyces erythrochromogenes]|uniref:hypothetical protein n=1 Tax=Streptomyces erythrochromogenes TaxID=285574 RepID=UPI00382F154E
MNYLRYELGRAEHALAAAEQTSAAAAQRRPLPQPPAWVIEHGIGDGRPPVSIRHSRLDTALISPERGPDIH